MGGKLSGTPGSSGNLGGCYRPVARCCFVFATGRNGGLPPKATNELILFIPPEIGIIGAQTLVRRGS
jgi:hypothetical protein